MKKEKLIYACDIGGTNQNNFAWARKTVGDDDLKASNDIDLLIQYLVSDLKDGHAVALGFEAPMFIPVPRYKSNLSSGRNNEGSRSTFAPPGGYVTTLGLHQVAYVLRDVREACDSDIQPTVDPQAWTVAGDHRLLLWEAFVSGDAKRAGSDSEEEGHMQDAVTALMHFSEHIDTPEQMRGITTDQPLSTLGTALLWSGWTTDVDVLHQMCLVAKPPHSDCSALQTLCGGLRVLGGVS